jgi:hypothetical protein
MITSGTDSDYVGAIGADNFRRAIEMRIDGDRESL